MSDENMINEEELKTSKPFLKWAGGKQKLLVQYRSFFPGAINNYYEPFLGGGAVFFFLKNEDKVEGSSFLFDVNEELINAYLVVRDSVEELIKLLSNFQGRHSKDFFYEIRSWDRKNKNFTETERAARTIYLNKACYNGLYRVNSKGNFNVPLGRYNNPKILDESVLRKASINLTSVTIRVANFSAINSYPSKGDFVYFDPPYYPTTKTANFTSYTPNNFSEEDQISLSVLFKLLSNRGVNCALSNSNTSLIKDLYKDYNLIPILANRAINSKAQGRKKIEELLITNY